MEYLLIISIAGMGILGIQDSRTQKLSLLQNIKKSCSIDSVWFEKSLCTAKAKVFLLISKLKEHLNSLEKEVLNTLTSLRCKLRHLLGSEPAHSIPSVFIQKMKNDTER